jgi:peptidoglycan hydrolase CwlO-like protein
MLATIAVAIISITITISTTTVFADSSNSSITDNIQKTTAAVDHLRNEVEDLVNSFRLLKEEVK